MKHTSKFLLAAVAASLSACHGTSGLQSQQKPLAENASVTVFPVLLGGQPNQDVATVVGIMLERGGLQNVEVEPKAYTPQGADFALQAADFGAHVGRGKLATDYALFATFVATPDRKFEEVSSALVDKKGEVVWLDRQRRGEAAFDAAKPDCPMGCTVLVAQRLRAPLKLADPLRPGAPEGKLAARMQNQAGVPSDQELETMQARLATLRAAGPKAQVRVFPVRIGSEWSKQGAQRLVTLLQERGLVNATLVQEPLPFAVEASSNEQKMLWSGAHSIQAKLRGEAARTEYSLFADFLLAKDGKAGAVHTYLLAPNADLVLVDFQNSHHDDFQRLQPKGEAACAELVATRLARHLK